MRHVIGRFLLAAFLAGGLSLAHLPTGWSRTIRTDQGTRRLRRDLDGRRFLRLDGLP